MSREGGKVGTRRRIEYDPDERRYVCTSFEVFRTPDASEGKGFVTSEVLRDLAVGHLITLTGQIQKRGDRKYQARWLDPEGRERAQTFSRKVDAERHWPQSRARNYKAPMSTART